MTRALTFREVITVLLRQGSTVLCFRCHEPILYAEDAEREHFLERAHFMTVSHDEIQGAIGAAVGWAGILRRHADEANKAAASETPDKWITDKAGWETLRDQLNEAAGALDGMATLVATIRAED